MTVDSQATRPPAISARAVTRRFPGVIANDKVSLDVMPGQIHGLLGENGSGKTTLCKMLTGLYRPDEGEILIDGKPVELRSPSDAFEYGIFMVQQHFSLIDSLTVAENLVLGWTPHSQMRFDRKQAEREVAEAAEKFNIQVDSSAYVWQLSVGERQRVEILRALYRGARILILDEPTTALVPQECDELFASMASLAGSDHSIIFISHKLREVMTCCDYVTVLRHGQRVGTVEMTEESRQPRRLAQLMVGREVVLERKTATTARDQGDAVLELAGVSAANDFGRLRVNDVSLSVHAGEIVGIAGVAGNGQVELAEAISGLRRRTAGEITVGGKTVRNHDPRSAIRAGLAYIPEDRLGVGLAPGLTITDNIMLKSFGGKAYSKGPFLSHRKARARTDELLERFGVKGKADDLVRELSGGNAQKVLLARELSDEPAALVIASPTRGLDVAAIESVRELLVKVAADGAGILLISEDLDEVLDLSDRIAVMYEGKIMGVLDREGAELDELGMLMAGIEVAA
ncbi:MAG: ABC transporter ATP-binding protein [Actinobacteria bacterium]|nr:ABC transporter ATP-binding protein [Actinomycetota bacterium]